METHDTDGAKPAGIRRWRWLESTARLQRETYGRVPGGDVESQARGLRENLFAAFVELAEVAREFSWKYWAKDPPYVNREKIIEELVDVEHFLGNMLYELEVTDDEWEEAYQNKQAENRHRQERHYLARKFDELESRNAPLPSRNQARFE